MEGIEDGVAQGASALRERPCEQIQVAALERREPHMKRPRQEA